MANLIEVRKVDNGYIIEFVSYCVKYEKVFVSFAELLKYLAKFFDEEAK
jgi:hypothetical protein